MAPRKDMMRIIRQDAGFSAKLGFGGTVPEIAAAPEVDTSHTPEARVAAISSAQLLSSPALPVPLTDEANAVSGSIEDGAAEVEGSKEAVVLITKQTRPVNPSPVSASAARGQVVYVAVSLTTRQAALAEAWATVAKCSVQFLIRRVAQGMRDDVFDDWELNGMPDVDEPRGSRSRHPTSVTFTLRPQFAATLSKLHDPLGIVGLGRTMGPAFRARFQVAFDGALAKAKIQMTTEGDKK